MLYEQDKTFDSVSLELGGQVDVETQVLNEIMVNPCINNSSKSP